MSFDLIIVGGGIAGSAAALRAAQYGHLKVLWIRGDKKTAKRSRGQWVANIDNMIGIHDGIVRRKVLKLLRGEEHAVARAKIEAEPPGSISTRDIVANTIDRIEQGFPDQVTMLSQVAEHARKDGDDFVVQCGDTEHRAPWVVLATGVMDRQPRVKREGVLDDPRWVYPYANAESFLYCIRCEGHLTRQQLAVVIGHSETTAQLAMMLHERYDSACCIATNGEEPRWSARSQRLLDAYGIGTHAERIVDVAGTKGELHQVEFEGGKTIAVRFALVSLGLYRVYNDLARDLGADLEPGDLPDEERHVLIEWNGRTSIPGLFAVGDMTMRRDSEPVMKQVYTSQEYAVRAVDTIDRAMRKRQRKKILGDEV